MKIGTLSLLLGVHQFLIHPWVVARAWRRLYHRWPTVCEWVAIFCHDLGYWGRADMDGAEGIRHPEPGGELAFRIVRTLLRFSPSAFHRLHREKFALDTAGLVFTHSRSYCQLIGAEVGPLFLPDKVSLIYDWTYPLRARLTGEWKEFLQHSPDEIRQSGSFRVWFRWYRRKVEERLGRWEEEW